MAGAQAQIDFTSNASQVERTLQSVERGMQAVTRRLADVERGSKKATESTTTGLQRGATAAAQFAGALTGVGSAVGGAMMVVGALKAEYDNLLARQRAAAATQVSAGVALREARKAFAPDATMGAGAFDGALQNLAFKRGSTVDVVAPVAQTAFSAKGDLSNAAAMSAIETAVRLSPTDAGEASTVAGRLLDMMKASGTSDARSVAAFLQTVQQSSRVTNMAAVGSNLVPAITSLVKSGDSPEQAAEVVAALNQLMSDETGALTRTAALQLGGQLKDFLPNAAGTQARIEALQADPKLRAEFLKKASFEQASKGFITSLLSGDAASVSAYQAAQRNIGGLNDGMAALFEQQLAFINSGKFQQMVDADQRGKANVEGKQLADRIGGLRGQIATTLSQALEETNEGFLVEALGNDALVRLRHEIRSNGLGVNPAIQAQNEVRRILREGNLSETDATFARQQLDALENLRKLMQSALDEQRKQTNALERPSSNPAQRALPSAQLRR